MATQFASVPPSVAALPFLFARPQVDDDWNCRREMASLRVELFPLSSRAHFTLANVATQQKNAELARKHYQEALRLVDTDADPQLTANMRATIRERSQQALAN